MNSCRLPRRTKLQLRSGGKQGITHKHYSFIWLGLYFSRQINSTSHSSHIGSARCRNSLQSLLFILIVCLPTFTSIKFPKFGKRIPKHWGVEIPCTTILNRLDRVVCWMDYWAEWGWSRGMFSVVKTLKWTNNGIEKEMYDK